MAKAKVVVNGVGAIGKRVAHAVKLQDDMKLVGISDVAPTSVLRTNLEPEGPLYKTDLYCSVPDLRSNLENKGFYVKGTLPELLESGKVDVVIDCSPPGIDEKNKSMYEKLGVKAICQGGADESIAQASFNSLVNFDESVGRQSTRVVSCNTTSLSRTFHATQKAFGIKKAFVSLVRRAVDPWNPSKGPINAIKPAMTVPSHHGPDLQTVMHGLDVNTMAVVVPTTLSHVHMVSIETKNPASKKILEEAFEKTSRVNVLNAGDGFSSTAEIMERYRDLGRPRSDMPEVAVWRETITAEKNHVYWMHAVHSESIVIPENVDAIRALTGLEVNNLKSIKKTNKALGIK